MPVTNKYYIIYIDKGDIYGGPSVSLGALTLQIRYRSVFAPLMNLWGINGPYFGGPSVSLAQAKH